MAIHLYYGDGKGKTTAAVGLCIRAIGHGKRVCVVQFLKRGDSGEVAVLKKLGATVYAGKAGSAIRVSDMTHDELLENSGIIKKNLECAKEGEYDIILLDELAAALEHKLLDEALLKEILSEKRSDREIIITGRRPPKWLFDIADYITEMKKVRHIYDDGVAAREGIEY